MRGLDIRSSRIRCDSSDLGDVLEGAGVGGLDDELLTEHLEALFGSCGHGGNRDDTKVLPQEASR